MVVLDCESLDSTYESVQSVFGLTRQAIEHVFASLDVEKFYSENRGYPYDAPHLLFEKIKAEASCHIQFDAVCWFHLSRVPSPLSFENGILPLGEQVEAIWDLLRKIVGKRSSDSEWAEFRQEMGDSHSAFLYRMKLNDPDHWGPYGMLVRDVAFSQTNLGSHYLTIPEIIEDISLCFADQFGFDLRSEYIQNSQPCIVKFIDENPHPRCLPPALYYLYSTFQGETLSLSCNTCFDGGGKRVGPQQILRIEIPELLAVAS